MRTIEMLSQRVAGLVGTVVRHQSYLNRGQQEILKVRKNRKVISSNVHFSALKAAKIFVDKENQYAHDILVRSLEPYQIFRASGIRQSLPLHNITELRESLLQPPAVQDDDVNATELYDHFKQITNFCTSTQTPISASQFTDFISFYCQWCHKLTDDQLLDSLRQMALLPQEESTRAPNFVDLWNTLDVECCARLEKWKTAQILLVCDAWYSLNLVRISEFASEALRKLGRKVRRMSPQELVQTMFMCNLMRRPIYEMHDFELGLEKCIDQLTLAEISVMAMGFFKTQTCLRNPALIVELYKRVLAEVTTVEDITLVALLKILRYSSKLEHVDQMMQLLEALKPQLERLSLLSCLHISLLGSDLQCCHDEVVELILQRFEREIDRTRLKDLERICLIIGLFNINTVSGVETRLFEQILAALNHRIDEILKHPRCFPTCLHFLAIRGHYDVEMLSAVLDMKFLTHAYGKNLNFGREIFALDSFVKINLKNSHYSGPQLAEKYRRTMGKLLTHYIPERSSKFRISKTDRILLEIKETVEGIFRHATFKHLLPHFERPDIVLCYDRQQRLCLPISKNCPENYSGAILGRAEVLGDHESLSEMETIAVVVAGWNNVVRGKDRHTGLFASKLNQLELLGHKYIVINWFDWRELETQADRYNYVRRRLSKIIQL